MKRVEPGIFDDQLLAVISIELVCDIGQRRGLEHQLPLSPRSRVGDVGVLILLNLLGRNSKPLAGSNQDVAYFPGSDAWKLHIGPVQRIDGGRWNARYRRRDRMIRQDCHSTFDDGHDGAIALRINVEFRAHGANQSRTDLYDEGPGDVLHDAEQRLTFDKFDVAPLPRVAHHYLGARIELHDRSILEFEGALFPYRRSIGRRSHRLYPKNRGRAEDHEDDRSGNRSEALTPKPPTAWVRKTLYGCSRSCNCRVIGRRQYASWFSGVPRGIRADTRSGQRHDIVSIEGRLVDQCVAVELARGNQRWSLAPDRR